MKNKASKIILGLLLVIYSLIVIIHTFFPSSQLNIDLSTKFGIAHLYSFPLLFGLIGAGISLSAILVYLTSKKNTDRVFIPIWIGFMISSIIFILFSSNPTKEKAQVNLDETIKIVEWNAINNISATNVETIFKEFDADIAVFPELDGPVLYESENKRFVDLFKQAGLDFDDYSASSSAYFENIAPVTVITKNEFANLTSSQVLSLNTFGTVKVDLDSDYVPQIIGMHTAPPLPFLMRNWEDDLNLIATEIIGSYSDAIIVGDFNATMRHGKLNEIESHVDILEYLPTYERGTWHASLPQFFRTPIDHILLPKDKYSVKNVQVRNLDNSDHAAIFAEIIRK